MSSNTKVSFKLEPSVHLYKKRKAHSSQQENQAESDDDSGAQTGRVQADTSSAYAHAHAPAEAEAAAAHVVAVAQVVAHAPVLVHAQVAAENSFVCPPAPLTKPPPPLNLPCLSDNSFSYGLKITVPNPGAYRAPSTSPPGSLSPNTHATIVREAKEGLERERALRKVEEAIRQTAIGLAHHTFLREDTPLEHLTPQSQRTPASIKSLRSPRMGLHLSPLQLSPVVQSPRVPGEDQGLSLRPRVMLRPIAEKNSLSSLSLDSLTLSNEGSFTSLNTMA